MDGHTLGTCSPQSLISSIYELIKGQVLAKERKGNQKRSTTSDPNVFQPSPPTQSCWKDEVSFAIVHAQYINIST